MWGVLSKFFPGGPLLPRSFQEALEACPGVVTRGIVGTHGCLELREREGTRSCCRLGAFQKQVW